jgi:hypothetical protein
MPVTRPILRGLRKYGRVEGVGVSGRGQTAETAD